jgi:hypothetical protein
MLPQSPKAPSGSRLRLLSLLAIAATACSGQVGSSGVTPGGSGGGMLGGTGGSGNPDDPKPTCVQPQAAPLHAQMLSPSQYNNVVRDLFGISGDFSKGFGGGADTQLDDLGVEQRANAAADVARQATAALATWAPCDPTKMAPATCQQQLIDKVGARAFRHPLAATERTQLAALFDAGVKEKDFATGVEWFLTGLLQLPDFLYQVARPAANEQAGQIRALSPYELASRLSFFLWDGLPDDQLFAAATASKLNDSAGLRAELDRLLKDDRFLRGVGRFYSSWLTLDRFAEVARDQPGFTSAVVSALQTSVLMTATQLYTSPSANVAGLFSGESYYLNDTLRTFYGLPGTGTTFAPATFAGEGRRGLLTHPGLMALLARPNATNPIARGLFVRKGLLCQEVPPPAATLIIPPLPPIAAGLSTRDRLDQHVSMPVCKACHDLIDPPGFALENWDQVGKHRTMDNGKTVDTSGEMTSAADLDGPFAQGDQLLQRVAASTEVKRCFAEHYLTFALARALTMEDKCSLEQTQKDFVPAGDLRGLVRTIASSDSFRFRQSEGVAP